MPGRYVVGGHGGGSSHGCSSQQVLMRLPQAEHVLRAAACRCGRPPRASPALLHPFRHSLWGGEGRWKSVTRSASTPGCCAVLSCDFLSFDRPPAPGPPGDASTVGVVGRRGPPGVCIRLQAGVPRQEARRVCVCAHLQPGVRRDGRRLLWRQWCVQRVWAGVGGPGRGVPVSADLRGPVCPPTRPPHAPRRPALQASPCVWWRPTPRTRCATCASSCPASRPPTPATPSTPGTSNHWSATRCVLFFITSLQP